jgi:hypothetical protein
MATLSGVPTFMIPKEITKIVSSDATALIARAPSTRPCVIAHLLLRFIIQGLPSW